MKPSILIMMSVGLVITIIGFTLCYFAQSEAKSRYPDEDLFAFDNGNYEIVDGDHIKTVDFSDTVYLESDDGLKEVKQDIKVLSLELSDLDSVEIIGNQTSSKVMIYNLQPGLYACDIGSGVITVTNSFKDSLLLNYLTDIFENFHGLRKYINFSSNKLGDTKKVVVYINDADVLKRIDLKFTNCKNVTVKDLTCSLDCKITLNSSNILFDNCKFKNKEVISSGESSSLPEESLPSAQNPSEELPGNSVTSGSEPAPNETSNANSSADEEQPIEIEHYLTIDLNMKNGSRFDAKNCRFSSFSAIVNKKQITQADIDSSESATELVLGSYVSSGGALCHLSLDFSTENEMLYGFSVYNVPDKDISFEEDPMTTVDGVRQPQIFLENEEMKDYPQIKINASNCVIDIKN